MVNEKKEIISNSWPEFRNQDESFEWPAIGKRACGPTVIAMAMNLLRRDNPNIPLKEPEDLLFELGHMNKLPISREPHYYLIVEHTKSKPKRYVAIGNMVSEGLRADIVADGARLSLVEIKNLPTSELSVYHPMFTLERGLDHRNAWEALAEYGIEAAQYGDPKDKRSSRDVIKEIQKGNMVICSVDYSEDSTHVLLITKYNETDQTVLVYDPKSHGPEWKKVKDFRSIFRGYGTIIKTKGLNGIS